MRPQRFDEPSEFDAWLPRARSGDPEALDALVRWLEAPLLGFARARRADDPHGVVNEVLVRACRSLDSFSGGPSDLRAWVFRIARNLVIDQTRARNRRVAEYVTAPADLPAVVAAGDPEDLVDEGPRVTAMLQDLSADQREVIVLRIIADLSVEDTAAIMGRKPGTIRVLQHRALARLRRSISGDL